MINSHFNKLQTINPQNLKQLLEKQSVTLIDVRELNEYAAEHIPGAVLLSLSKFNFGEVLQNKENQVILYCRSGNRSKIAAQKLLDAGFTRVTQLDGGISAWKQAGYTTKINNNAPISLMRQVQIIAGFLVFTGTLLGVFLSPWFLLLSGFVGAGLMFAGITDTCALGILLAKLPYNQHSQS